MPDTEFNMELREIALYDINMSDEGHRSSYVSFFSGIFNLNRIGTLWEAVLSRRPILVPMIEESFGKYAAAALVRALLGRRTAGLLFRPRPAVEGRGLRMRVKYLLLRLLRATPGVSTLTILPFSVEPRFSEIAHNWIYDPQLWDLSEAERERATLGELTSALTTAANGRRICVALGRQDASKGFDWFAGLYSRNPELRQSWLFAFGGKISGEVSNTIAAFEKTGGYACNRFISDDELLGLYAGANLVWCAYAADYDQASGIFGRAVQMGIPVAVRRGSLIHRQCEIEQIAHIAIGDADEWQPLMTALPATTADAANTRKQRMREESLSRLHQALGFAP